ncbi:DUF6247 family protein [Sphaerisporangium sp. NPDC051017]|uniref:DUF6247 family protein n=1 Tax=Sphaerisporangium sp. NPDC051017 TaxID=3154636 RepID=UPI00342C8022
MSAQLIHETVHDPQAIMEALPDKWRPQFLAEYKSAVEVARRPERFHQLQELLHRWWLKSIALSDPGFETRQQEVLAGTVETVPIGEAIPDWDERLARARRR